MGKARNNKNMIEKNLETICLDCCSLGFLRDKIDYKWYYKIEELECPVCKKKTKHVVCKNIDNLKSELRFCNTRREIDDLVLETLETNYNKKVTL